MNTKYNFKKDMYQAIGFTLILIVLAFPVSILGIKMLNLVLANIQ